MRAQGDLYSTDATQLGKMISREMITYPIVRPQSLRPSRELYAHIDI